MAKIEKNEFIISDCNKCNLHLLRNNIVNGEGPLDAKWLFVGEAPGSEEDATARPFQGEAGRTLNALLFEAGISRNVIRISNLIKCKPPNNRDPEFEELKACSEYLKKEIEAINPSIIIAMGRVASLFLTEQWKSWRGSFSTCKITDHPYRVLITNHPAYCLPYRNPDAFAVLVHDLEKLHSRPEQIKENYMVNPPLELVEDFLFKKWKNKPVAVDFETIAVGADALDPWQDDILGCGFCGEPGVAITLTFSKLENIPIVKKFLSNSTPKILHNALFDRMFSIKKLGFDMKNVVWDTMDTIHVLNSDAPKSLEFLRSLYVPTIPPYKQIYRNRDTGVSHLSLQQLGRYCNLDVDITKRVSIAQKPFLTSDLEKIRLRHLDLQQLALNMRNTGVNVDKKIIAMNYLEFEPKVSEYDKEFWNKFQCSISSPQQVGKLFYDKFLLPIPPSAKGKRSVDIDCLKYLSDSNLSVEAREAVELKIKYQSVQKNFGTYIVGLYKQIKPDGRVHPDWRPTGADTGRWSCNTPSMMNIPKDLRNCFIPEEGKVFYGFDYSGLELYTIALIAKEWKLATDLKQGKDVHAEIMKEMTKFYPANRRQAKNVVFGTTYGRSAFSIAKEFHIPVHIAKAWMDICMNKFPMILKKREEFIRLFEKQGYLSSIFGRRKYCKTAPQALNFPIQSAAADITLNACMELDRRGFNPVITVHDSVVCEVVKNEKSFEEFKQIAENSYPELSDFFRIKAEIGTNWEVVS